MASQNNSTLISKIYKSRMILLELMGQQGFETDEYSGFGVNEVNAMQSNDQLDMILEKKTEDKKKIYIKYYLGNTLRPKHIQEMIDDLFMVEEVLGKNDTLMLVVKNDANDTLIDYIKHLWETDKIFIIVISLDRLQFNILKHVLVPPHRILSESEKIQVMTKYNINNDGEFPEIVRFDPVAQAICIRPGEVCEILRPSKTAITAPYYRICI